jgi:hypothetical protein
MRNNNVCWRVAGKSPQNGGNKGKSLAFRVKVSYRLGAGEVYKGTLPSRSLFC